MDQNNVTILDACRYDLFESVLKDHKLPGQLMKRQSIGSATPEFLKKNFMGGELHDTVYITANPYVNTKLPPDTFHEIIPVWKIQWNEELQTVTPEAMLEYAQKAAHQYPNERLIIHCNQPHVPFIGDIRLDGRKASAIRQEALGEERLDPAERSRLRSTSSRRANGRMRKFSKPT